MSFNVTMKLVSLVKTHPKTFVIIALLIGLLVWLVALPMAKDYLRYRNSMSLIKDIKALKLELEEKLNTKLSWDNDCMTPQSLNNASADVWSCEIQFESNNNYKYDENLITSIVMKKSFVFDPRTLNNEVRGAEFYFTSKKIGGCGLYFGAVFGVRCGFAVDKMYRNRINNSLGIN